MNDKSSQTPKYLIEKTSKQPKEPKQPKTPKAKQTMYKIYFCINNDKTPCCSRPYISVLNEDDKKEILNISKISSYTYDDKTYIQLYINEPITNIIFLGICKYINDIFDKRWLFTYKIDKTIQYKTQNIENKPVFISDDDIEV